MKETIANSALKIVAVENRVIVFASNLKKKKNRGKNNMTYVAPQKTKQKPKKEQQQKKEKSFDLFMKPKREDRLIFQYFVSIHHN